MANKELHSEKKRKWGYIINMILPGNFSEKRYESFDERLDSSKQNK